MPKACIFAASEWAERLTQRVPDGIEQRLVSAKMRVGYRLGAVVLRGARGSTQLQFRLRQDDSRSGPVRGRLLRRQCGLAVAMVGIVLGAPLPVIMRHLQSFGGVPGRLEQVVPSVYVDYAHARCRRRVYDRSRR